MKDFIIIGGLVFAGFYFFGADEQPIAVAESLPQATLVQSAGEAETAAPIPSKAPDTAAPTAAATEPELSTAEIIARDVMDQLMDQVAGCAERNDCASVESRIMLTLFK